MIEYDPCEEMIEDDHCEECRILGDDYSYDEDGDLVSNCYDCPLGNFDAWMGRDEYDD